MKQRIVFWVERYFYAPTVFDRIVSVALLPLSLVYCLAVWVRYLLQKPQETGIKVVGVGNLTVGGSGKTPFVSALALKYVKPAVVLRGYGRCTKGLRIVKEWEDTICDAKLCGDEAMVYAAKLPHALVIVSEERKKGIEKAKEMGASIVFLDDAYSKHDIKKLDIVIEVESKNPFCLPSGPFREKLWYGKKVLKVKEGRDFIRKVHVKDATPKMVLVTAIARPQRLEPFLPEGIVARYFFEDHHSFGEDEVKRILHRHEATSLLVTLKDYVKLKDYDIPLSLLDLELEIDKAVFNQIDRYITLK